ncbi:SCL-interrupting locus protein homolog [Pecten maximus]|uniref:SCL-interrupting locus protein homolog n=1 Tax=Pecten maximus TaxID=6579 RepID=UPI0014589B9D|nr:SCL-interrupting locus protein homolog [Pecten maximus]XP_033737227.1 SCL-interrupting locus protein homolog [Pecten maximus]
MAMPGEVKNLPNNFQMHPHVHFESSPVSSVELNRNGEIQRQKKSSSDENQMLKFPNTRGILWDHKCIDTPVQLHISYYRKPKLCVLERVIRFAQRHLQSTGQQECSCALVGSLSIDEDGEGVKFTLDRFDPGGGLTSSVGALTSGDMAVPLQIMGNTKKERESSIDDYLMGLKVLKQRCCAKEPLDVGSFLLVKGWCNFFSTGDKSVHHLEFDIITMGTELKAVPITPVPIVPTALSKNLSGPMSLSHLQGEPKTGYLTMDHTRKVLLVLESDPKVFSLPLVGIWVSGVPFVYSPFVWAACLRYIHNSSITDRICSPPEPFLLVLYSPVHSKPEFYELSTMSGTSKMEFDLLTGYEVVSISKSNDPNATFDVDLNTVKNGHKRELFDGALHQFTESSSSGELTQKPAPTSDEITPRNIPAPHKSKLPAMMPMVPEVSLLFGEDGQSGIFADGGPKRLAINQGRPQGINNIKDFNPQRPLTNIPGQPGMPAYSQQPPHYSAHSSQQPQRRMPLHSHSAPELNQLYHQQSRQPRPHSTTGTQGPPVSRGTGTQGPPVSRVGIHNYMGNMALSEEDNQVPGGQPLYHQNTTHRGMSQLNGLQGQTMTNGYDTPSGRPFPVSQGLPGQFQQHSQQVSTNSSSMPHPKQVPYVDHNTQQQQGSSFPRTIDAMSQHPHIQNMSGQVPRSVQPPVPVQPQPRMSYPDPRVGQNVPFTGPAGPSRMHQPYSQQPRGSQPQSAFVHHQHIPASHGQVYPTSNEQIYPMSSTNGQIYPTSSSNGQINPTSSSNGQVYLASNGQIYPTSSTNGQIYPTSSTNGQIYPTSSTNGQIYPTSSTNGQIYPESVPSSNGHVYSNAPNIGLVSKEQMTASHSKGQMFATPQVSGGVVQSMQGKSSQFTPVSGGQITQKQDQRRSTTEGDSSKSSDDSGLSFTPEKGNNVKCGASPPDGPKESSMPQALGGSDINWNQVPKEVYQLLLQQDAQLKQLQTQIQMLMHSQSASTQCTTMTDLPPSINSSDTRDSLVGPMTEESKQKNNMCSVGVNTTMQCPRSKQSVMLQTSPQKARPQLQHQVSLPHSQSSSDGPHPYSQHTSHHSSEESQCSMGERRQRSSGSSSAPSEASGCSNDPRTPAEIRHRGLLPLNSTEREEEVDVSQGDLSHVMDNMAVHNQTVDSVQSEIIVDLPSYQSSPSRSITSRETESNEFSKSPLSASMCGGNVGEGDSEDEEDVHDDKNTKQYYDRLMDNIHKMLNQQSVEDMDSGHVEMTKDTLQQSIMLGHHLSNMQRYDVSSNPADTTYIPKINYMSMLFDSDSDSSMEINAMAMKYLNDEQLTQMSKAHSQAAHSRGVTKGLRENQRLAMLKHVLQNDKDSTPNVTTMGISPNDMTFATRKYMEKHGLLSETNSDSSENTLMDDTYRLKLDYSTATSGSDTPAQVTPEVLRHRPVKGTPQNRTPNSHNVSVSPFGHKEQFTAKTRSPLINGHNKDYGSPCVEKPRKIGTPYSNFSPATPKSTRGVEQFSSPQPPTHGVQQFSPHVHTPVRTCRLDRSSEKGQEDNCLLHGQTSNNATPTRQHIHCASSTRPQGYDDYSSPMGDNRRVVTVDRVLSPIAREPSPPPQPREDDDNILDITRLKTLPKLL